MLGFATLFVEPFKNLQIARAVDSSTSSTSSSGNSTTSTSTAIKSHKIDANLLDYGSYMRGENSISMTDLPLWKPDSLSKSAPMGSIEQLNYTANAMYKLKCDDSLDILSSFITEDSIKDVDYFIDNNNNLVSLKIANKEKEDYYYSAYYKHATPIIYFNTSLSGTQNISFYMPTLFDMNDITHLKNAFPYLKGELPLIVINDQYTFLKIVFDDHGWSLMTDNYARFDACYRNPIYNTESHPYLMMKVTLPYLDSIQDIKVFSSFSLSYAPIDQDLKPESDILFRFDESMHDKYYFYLFDICSLSVLKKELIVDNSTYYTYHHIDGTQHDEMIADFVSMKVLFTGTRKEKNNAIQSSRKGLKADVSPYNYIPIIPKEIELTFDRNIGYVDGKIRCWFFDEFELEDNVSGQFKILSISFHPYIYDSTGRMRIDESTLLTHHYESANIHKYSYDIDRAIRTYYYNMTSYFRKESDSSNGPTGGTINMDHIFGWICFGFEFYFDKQRKNPIPNVKNITIKYQCGYKEPNPDPESNGFYPNCDDPYKNVRVKTMEVVESKVRGIGALDNEGMCLTNNGARKMMHDDNGIRHDYVIYKHRQRGPNPGITTMDALEIRYETGAGEMVRMVGNSKGLHVVVDEDGIARVYNSEGGLEEDYGVYESNDGTLVPGQDLNGDGKIDSDEVINSDTGIKSYAPFEDDSSWGQQFINSIIDFFNKQKSRIISTLIIIGLIVFAVIFVPKLFGKRKKS